MCGIFGIISDGIINHQHLKVLAKHAKQRGKDSSGLMYYNISSKKYAIIRADHDISKLLNSQDEVNANFVFGHSRLITNGLTDNQPVFRDEISVIHNGIVVNEDQIWSKIEIERKFKIDTETIVGLAKYYLDKEIEVDKLAAKILANCKGTISAAIALPRIGKLILFTNNGSLYVGKISRSNYFSSEKFPLEQLNCDEIQQVDSNGLVFDILPSKDIDIIERNLRTENLIPVFKNISKEKELLEYKPKELKRCSKCILPETMPFIYFDEIGVCNYCNHYLPRNNPKPKQELMDIVEPYRKLNGPECIVPFSGGRDSCWGLHLVTKELGLKAITYTYDWGMVTDLGRRNISRMCSELGVENIIIADDISKKRRNILLNLKAWLKSPHLGMISILTAGDKHFFRHVETVKKQTGVKLNLWGVNPLEVTHFKAGFLGVPPDFEEKKVYSNGAMKQLNYQRKRFMAMLQSLGYFNRSIWDTLSGEYYRSFTVKKDYFHIYDYWRWDEIKCNETLKEYDWELAPDTSTTWRIGDGTAAFYNYIYFTVAGFTEHDTFRSNQIREGQITREEALALVSDENQPRYQNIKWYLDAIGLDFIDVIKTINRIPKLH